MNATAADGSSVRPILVGIDGSSSALAAARWAARESGIREASIRLVNAFGWMPVHDADDPVQIVPDPGTRCGGPPRSGWPLLRRRWPKWHRTCL